MTCGGCRRVNEQVSSGVVMVHTGRHFLQIPGPTNVPDRVLRAMARPTIDHRGPEFAALGHEVLEGMRPIFQNAGPVIMYPSSGTGGCEAALVNTLSPGDRVLIMETGWFSHIAWRQVAEKLGLQVDYVPGDWRRGASPEEVEARLSETRSTPSRPLSSCTTRRRPASTSRIGEIRRAMNRARHPALLHRRHDFVARVHRLPSRRMGSRRHRRRIAEGLMLPPGLGFNAVSEKALAASRTAKLPRSYWDWQDDPQGEQDGFFPYTPVDESAVRTARSARHAPGRRAAERLPPPCASRRGDARGGARLGPGDVLRGAARVLELADGGPDAGGPRRRRPPRASSSTVRHVARHRLSARLARQGVSASATSAPSTI